MIGIIPIIINLIGNTGINYYYNTTFVLTVFGVLIMGQNGEAVKSINKGDYQAYKTICKKVGWEYATVDNNEILSKKVNKPIKKVVILGPTKSMQAGDSIGIIHARKEFWAFPLNE